MIAVIKSQTIQSNFKDICNQVWSGYHILISRPKNKNVVVLAEPDYQALIAQNDAAMDAKLNQGWQDIKASKGIYKNI
jgi:hypothetical protein